MLNGKRKSESDLDLLAAREFFGGGGVSIAELSDISGISESSLRRMRRELNKRQMPTMAMCVRLARELWQTLEPYEIACIAVSCYLSRVRRTFNARDTRDADSVAQSLSERASLARRASGGPRVRVRVEDS